MEKQKPIARRAQARAIADKPGVPMVRALDRGVALLRAFDIAKPRQTL